MDIEERLEPTPEASSSPVPGVIENPVINSPYEEPGRHSVVDNQGITNQTAQGVLLRRLNRKEAELERGFTQPSRSAQ